MKKAILLCVLITSCACAVEEQDAIESIITIVEYGKVYNIVNEMHTFPTLENGLKDFTYKTAPFKTVVFRDGIVETPAGKIEIAGLRSDKKDPVTFYMKVKDDRWKEMCVFRSPNGINLMLHDNDGHITYMFSE